VSLRAQRVTSADVARAAGVARATVSYVLNNHPHHPISDATRMRVLAAAEELGYQPSAAARALRRGRSDIVLGLLPGFPIGHTLGEFLQSLSEEFAAEALTFVIHPLPTTGRPPSELWRAISPAAVVSLDAFDSADLASVQERGIPVVEVVYAAVDDEVVSVTIPNRDFGRAQAALLIDRGHVRIGYAYPDDERVSSFAQLRLEGVREACAAAGLPGVELRTVSAAVNAKGAVAAWREAGVTGVAAYNDEIALAVLAGASAAGLRVPADLAVVGVDDIPSAATAQPPLTTLRTDLRAVAKAVVAATLAEFDHSPVAAAASPTVSVVSRQSV
jgi:DNA-binding LacI/PurR family transcriptional regulator